MPAFPLTVPDEVYTAVANVAGEPFADSYLWGARIHGGKLHLRTRCGWDALMGNHSIREVLKKLGLDVPRPTFFPGDGTRPSASELGFSAAKPSRGKRSSSFRPGSFGYDD